ncbi:MAG: hypothetical protein SPG79_01020, partial [Candidatus Faecousia sp.]|nr:hypothetical protein [Candidatus Faecousia sp.]
SRGRQCRLTSRDGPGVLSFRLWVPLGIVPWVLAKIPAKWHLFADRNLRLHRIIRQGSSARDFVPVQSFKNGGILYVFPVFETAEMVQKIR